MQSVKQEEGAYQLVLGQFADNPSAGFPGSSNHVENSLEPVAVELQECLNGGGRGRMCRLVRDGSRIREKRIEPAETLELTPAWLGLSHTPPLLSSRTE